MRIRIVPAGIFNKKDYIYKFYKLVFLYLYLIVTLLYQIKLIEAASPDVKKAKVPKIDDLKPRSGGTGTTVTIVGSGFGEKFSPDEDKVIFGDDFRGEILGDEWSDKKIKVKVPDKVKPGVLGVVVTVNKKQSNKKSFKVLNPKITGIRTKDGSVIVKPNEFVIISGSDFGKEMLPGSSVTFTSGVTVSGNKLQSWDDREIRVTVPAEAKNGPVTVNIDNSHSDNFGFIIETKTSSVSNITPNTGSEGDKITINGSNFGSKISESSKVLFSGSPVEQYDSWSDEKIIVKIPKDTPIGIGHIDVIVGNVLSASGGQTFTVKTPIIPEISQVNPSNGAPSIQVGKQFEVIGKNFGATGGKVILCMVKPPDNKELCHDADDVQNNNWTDAKVTATIPILHEQNLGWEVDKNWSVKVTANGRESSKYKISVEPLPTSERIKVNFYVGADILRDPSNNNGYTSLPHLGFLMDTYTPITDYTFIKDFRTSLGFKLTGVTTSSTGFVSTSTSNASTNISTARSFEGLGGVGISLFKNDYVDYLLQYKMTADDLEDSHELLLRHFIGFRILGAGKVINSGYTDIGIGQSAYPFRSPTLFKFEAFLPLVGFGLNGFIKTDIETGNDQTQNPPISMITLGMYTDVTNIFKSLGGSK